MLFAFLSLSLSAYFLLHYFINIYGVADNGDYNGKEQALVTAEDRNGVLMSSCSIKYLGRRNKNERREGVQFFSAHLLNASEKTLNR